MSSSPTPLRGDSEDHDDRRIRQVVGVFLAEHPPIPGYDADELYQEARIAWLRAGSTYRADGGAARVTYLGRIVENRLRDISRAAHAARRWSPRGVVSIDMPTVEEGDSLAEFLRDPSPGPAEQVEEAELAEHLAAVLELLTPRQRQLLDARLEGRLTARIARDLGVSRDTLYDELRRLQQVCRDAGLEKLLR